MKHILPITIFLSLMITTVARAQDTFGLLYTISFPTGNTNDYLSKASFRGVTLDFRHQITPEVAAGFSTGWYTFYERKDYDTYSVQGNEVTFSGIQYRYLNSAPLLALVDYYFKPDEAISPFAGLGIGSTYNRATISMGLYEVDIESWHFTLAPEVGVQFTGGIGASGFLSARYNYNFAGSDLETQSYISLNIGVLLGM